MIHVIKDAQGEIVKAFWNGAAAEAFLAAHPDHSSVAVNAGGEEPSAPSKPHEPKMRDERDEWQQAILSAILRHYPLDKRFDSRHPESLIDRLVEHTQAQSFEVFKGMLTLLANAEDMLEPYNIIPVDEFAKLGDELAVLAEELAGKRAVVLQVDAEPQLVERLSELWPLAIEGLGKKAPILLVLAKDARRVFTVAQMNILTEAAKQEAYDACAEALRARFDAVTLWPINFVEFRGLLLQALPGRMLKPEPEASAG